MPSREELESHPVTTLKKEISKTNIKGYSKMKKPEIVELMLKNKDRFHHIKMTEKKTKKEKPKEDKPKAKLTSTSASGKVTELKLKEAKPKKKKLVIKEKEKAKAPAKATDILSLMNKFNKKYNADEIKKLTKSNLKEVSDLYFKELEQIENELKNVDDPVDFIKQNTKVSSLFTDIKKNFIRRIKKQLKSKPKAQISEVDFMEKSILDDIEKEVKKSKYKDRLDMNTLIEAGENMEKSQRLRAFEIIKKIRKTINTKEVNNLYPLEVIKKRLKL